MATLQDESQLSIAHAHRRIVAVLVSMALLVACGQPEAAPHAAPTSPAPRATAPANAAATPPPATSAPVAPEPTTVLPPPKDKRNAAQQKIDSNLLAQITGDSRNKSTLVDVDISASVSDNLLARIQSYGAEVLAADAPSHSIRARAPLNALERIAAEPDVRFIAPALAPMTNS